MIFNKELISPDASIAIDGFTGSITKRRSSHKGAWSRIIQHQLFECGYDKVKILEKGDNWNLYDIIIIEMGMEYKGTLNLFGGANDALAERLASMYEYWATGGTIYTVEGDFPDIKELIESRWNSASDNFKLLKDFNNWDDMRNSIRTIDSIYESNNVLIGDSHSLSVWEPGYEIHRYDGKTLYGMLNTDEGYEKGLSLYLPDRHIKNLKLYFGNIDIRHHIMRTTYPSTETMELVDRYISDIKKLRDIVDQVTLVLPLPIENESRKLPKTGYYKGTPFYGTQSERDNIRKVFSRRLHNAAMKYNYKIQPWPSHYINEHGELDMNVMEKPKSVHLSPEYYQYDLFERKENKLFFSDNNQRSLF